MPYVLRRESRPDTPEKPDLAAWFGRDYDAEIADRAITRVGACLNADLNGATVKATPTLTGAYALRRVVPANVDYPSLPDDLQRLIRSRFTQARVEHIPPKGARIKQVSIYDSRLAYLACCREVPVYTPTTFQMDNHADFAGRSVKGFYEVEVTVPDTWSHVGLVPCRPRQYDQYWSYPATPGTTFTSWLTTEEVYLLQEEHWAYTIKHRWLFRKAEGSDPLRQWAERLANRIEQLDAMIVKTSDDPTAERATQELRYIRAGLRSVALNTIGYFHSSGATEIHVLKRGDPIPDDWITMPGFTAGMTASGIQVSFKVPHTGMAAQFNHPEWAVWIWAKNRCRTTRLLLTVPRNQIVAVHNDAAYTSAPQPAIVDSGKVGAYRLKYHCQFPNVLVNPTAADLAKAIDSAVRAQREDSHA